MDGFFTIRLPGLAIAAGDETKLKLRKLAQPNAVAADPSDEVLLSRICDGDQEALSLLFRRYARIVRGVAQRVLRDSSEADDLVQDIFLLIHRLCRTFDSSKGSAKFWILQMTYRRAISRRRYLTSRYFYKAVDIDDVAGELKDLRAEAALPEIRLLDWLAVAVWREPSKPCPRANGRRSGFIFLKVIPSMRLR